MLSRLASDQIPYATMAAVNNVAFAVRSQQSQRLPQVFDRPTPLIKGAVRVVKATKESLTAKVEVDPRRTVALQAHEMGGRRNVQKLEAALRNRGLLPMGSAVVPVDVDLDVYGNPRRAAVNQVVNWLMTGTARADGPASYGELLRAVVTETALEWTPAGRMVTLTGRVAAPPEAPTTWTLQGVVKTMRDGAQRGARCTVIHPRARPGDTVTAGAETFELYRLEYRIAPTEAWMEVWEEN